MVKCPKCGEDIKYLNHFQSGEVKYTYDGKDYTQIDILPDNAVLDYECPECSEVLFTDEEKATNFLL